CKILDHTNLNDFPFFNQNPSAEKIALFIFENIKKELNESKDIQKEPFLYAVDVFETETSRARYCPYL
ncbi:MAG: 6-carboxytetrahydropterin synthase, partial [Spirochaetia bacterium]|nr:6-carboxytetrahydropterin synthase [Spirochaetia bacterium]